MNNSPVKATQNFAPSVSTSAWAKGPPTSTLQSSAVVRGQLPDSSSIAPTTVRPTRSRKSGSFVPPLTAKKDFRSSTVDRPSHPSTQSLNFGLIRSPPLEMGLSRVSPREDSTPHKAEACPPAEEFGSVSTAKALIASVSSELDHPTPPAPSSPPIATGGSEQLVSSSPDISTMHQPNLFTSFPRALATANRIVDVRTIDYPDGIKRAKQKYDRDFLLQFVGFCKGKPENMSVPHGLGIDPLEVREAPKVASGGRSAGRRTPSVKALPPKNAFASIGMGINGSPGKSQPSPRLSTEDRWNAASGAAKILPAFVPVEPTQLSWRLRHDDVGARDTVVSQSLPKSNTRTRSQRGRRGNAAQTNASLPSTTSLRTGIAEMSSPSVGINLPSNVVSLDVPGRKIPVADGSLGWRVRAK